MLKHAADLSDAHEYFIVWVGETNARPWGTKAEGYKLFPEFEQALDGVDLTSVVVPAGSTAGTTNTFSVTVNKSLKANQFANATLRLGTRSALIAGYGVIQSHDAIDVGGSGTGTGNLTVTWTAAASAAATTRAWVATASPSAG